MEINLALKFVIDYLKGKLQKCGTQSLQAGWENAYYKSNHHIINKTCISQQCGAVCQKK